MADAARYWEDVQEGQELSLVEPMSTQRLVIWAAASSDFYQIHYDEEFAKKNHLPGIIVHGALKHAIIGRLLDEWVGPQGRILRWDVSYRGMDPAREDVTVWARVTRRYQEQGEGRIDLEVGVRGADGAEGTPGTATVALPMRGEGSA
jgi:acyl dehydratase